MPAQVIKTIIKVSKRILVKNKLPVSKNQQVIYNGCNVPIKKEHPFKIDKEKINIAYCGRFEYQKGTDILIERLKVINKRFNDIFVFHLIGNGSYIQDVLKLSKLNANVLVYQAVPNISDKLYAFDYIIMPPRFEGLVLISIEASFSKVPVIAAVAPGLSETLPTDWPLQFHLENENELLLIFEKIKNKEYDLDVLKNQEYDLAVLKNQAFSIVSVKFSQSKVINAYSNLYLEIIE